MVPAHKLAGIAAAAGQSLDQVAALACGAAAELDSMGGAFGVCTTPVAGRLSFKIGPAEIKLGLAIHSEPGVERAWAGEFPTALEMPDAYYQFCGWMRRGWC